MRHLQLIKLLLLAVVFSLPVYAEEAEETATSEETVSETNISVGATSHLLGTQAGTEAEPNGTQFKNFTHETTLRTEYGGFSGDMSFSSRFTPDGTQSKNSGFLMEKKSITYQDDVWNLRAGDSHTELGRGLILSLFREPTFGIDNTLEGAHLSAKPDGFDLGLFGGRVNKWKAPISRSPMEQGLFEKDTYLMGGNFSVELTQGTKIGPQYVILSHQDTKTKAYTDQIQITGVALSSDITDEVQLYGEYNIGSHQNQDEQLPTSYLGYSSITWSPDDWKLKAEVKEYRGVKKELAPFRRPPLFDEDFVKSINNEDITAGKLYVEHKIGETTYYTSYQNAWDREFSTQIHHPIAGMKYLDPSGVETELKAGYRWMPHVGNIAHGAVKGKVKTGKGQYLELEYRKQIFNEALETPAAIRTDKNIAILGYTFSERWNATLGYEFLPHNPAAGVGDHFANLGAVYHDGPFEAKGFLGKTSGGSLCSGGVCLPVPPFTGAFLETIYTF